MEPQLSSSAFASITHFLVTAMWTSATLLHLFLCLLCAIVHSCYLQFQCSEELIFVWEHGGRVAQFSTSVTAPVVSSSTATFSLLVADSSQSHLRWLLLGVIHGISLRDVLYNVVKQGCRLTSQILNQRLRHFSIDLKLELELVAKAFGRGRHMWLSVASKYSPTFLDSRNTPGNCDL